MKCISCSHWNLRESGRMAPLGFAICELDAKHTFYSVNHACDRFKELGADKVKARVVWLDKQKG